MDLSSISTELSHSDTLSGGFTPAVLGLASLEEVDHMMNLHMTMPDVDIKMADAGDEALTAVDMRKDSAQFTASETPILDDYLSINPEMLAILRDDVAMIDTMETAANSKQKPTTSVTADISPGKGKGIFDYLGEVAKAKQKTYQTLDTVDRPNQTIVTNNSSNIQGTISLATLSKRSAPGAATRSDGSALKRRCISPMSSLLGLSANHATRDQSRSLAATPREIRDQIYTAALTQTKPILLDNISSPALTLLNQQFKAEALPIYYAVNTFQSHLHMPHTYEEALDPSEHHKAYKSAEVCSGHLQHLSRNWDVMKAFAVRKVKFDVMDKDGAHFATLMIEVSKRSGGSVKIECTEGPEVVAESEQEMCTGMQVALEPVLRGMIAREDFIGLTVEDLKALAEKVIVPYKPDVEDNDDDEGKD